MPDSKSSAAPQEKSIHNETNGKENMRRSTAQNNGFDAGALLAQAKTWVEENQTAAMVSGFGFGVFIGVLLRR